MSKKKKCYWAFSTLLCDPPVGAGQTAHCTDIIHQTGLMLMDKAFPRFKYVVTHPCSEIAEVPLTV